MQRVPMRYLLTMTPQEVAETLTGEFIGVFDDGEMRVHAAETIYCSFVWDIIRRYPDTPLSMKHHLKGIGANDRFSINQDLQLLTNIIRSVYETYKDRGVQFDPDLNTLAYETVNATYVGMLDITNGHQVTIDLLHLMEVMDHPEIFKANTDLKRRVTHDPNYVHEVIGRVLNDPTQLPGNTLASETRSKILKDGQVKQMVGPRGYAKDMDSKGFYEPIRRGYVEGIRDLYGSLAESRSAAESSYYQEKSLRQSEYFSRKLQFVAENVQHLHHGDCGTTEYLEWDISDKRVDDNGVKIRSSDLMLLHGKYYLHEESGTLQMITPQRRELLGKRVKIRSVLNCCHPDPVGICSTCYGALAASVPHYTNIGQLCATAIAQQATQLLLSNKHYVGSAKLDTIKHLDEHELRMVRPGQDQSSYYFADALEGKGVQLILKENQAQNLSDIYSVGEITDLNESSITELAYINLNIPHDLGYQTPSILVEVNGRSASLTYAMLEYIKRQGLKTTPEGNYAIDLKDWDWSEKFLILPPKHFNNSDHIDKVGRMLESRVGEMRKKNRSEPLPKLLKELYEYVNWKLDVNLAALEVVFYSTLIVSYEDEDYSLPKPWTKASPGALTVTMANRSLSVAVAFEKQYEFLSDLNSFLNTNRMDHIFDGVIMPHALYGKHD